jgi:nucleoside-diphosphate-sugar epimerase
LTSIRVTGASGFLGGRVARLAAARGWDVIGLGRDERRGAALTRDGVPFVSRDLADVAGMVRCFSGADVVVHSAGLCGPWARPAEFEAANVAGTARVVEACARAGVRRLLHVSSSSVYLSADDRIGIREDSPLPPPFGHYARTKAASEGVARRFEGEVAVLRPRGIHGPGDTTLLPRLVGAMRRGWLPTFRGGKAVVDLTHVDVVADAVLAASIPGGAVGTFNVSHGEGIPVRNLLERVAAHAGLRPRLVDLPVRPSLSIAGAAAAFAALLPGAPEPPVTPYAIALLTYSQTLDIGAMDRAFGWRPHLSMDEGLVRTLGTGGVA